MLPRAHARPSASMWLGLLVGFTGVVLVLWPRLVTGGFAPASSASAAAGVLSIAALTFGTLAQKRLGSDDLRAAGCVQNLGAALVAVLATISVGNLRRWSCFVGSIALGGAHLLDCRAWLADVDDASRRGDAGHGVDVVGPAAGGDNGIRAVP